MVFCADFSEVIKGFKPGEWYTTGLTFHVGLTQLTSGLNNNIAYTDKRSTLNVNYKRPLRIETIWCKTPLSKRKLLQVDDSRLILAVYRTNIFDIYSL